MVTDHPQHVLLVAGIAVERTPHRGHFGAHGIAGTCHDGGDGPGDGAGFIAIIRNAGHHQQAAQVGVAQA